MGRDPSWWDAISPPSESSSDECKDSSNSRHSNVRHTGCSRHTWASTPHSGARSEVPAGRSGGPAATRVGLGGGWAAGMQLGRYRLCKLLDETHFSSVWLAQPAGGPAAGVAADTDTDGTQLLLLQQQQTQNLAKREEDSGTRCGGSGGGEALGARGVAEPSTAAHGHGQGNGESGSCCAGGPDQGGTQGLRGVPGGPGCDTVVIKVLDASRPSAAAAAATELAALRRLRQLQQLHEQHQNRNTIDTHLLQQENLRQQQQQQQEQQHQQYGRREGAEAAHVGHAAGQVSAGWPFVQLLDSFTWRHGGAAQGSGSRSGSGSMGTAGGSGCVVSGGGGGGGGGVSGGGGGGGGDAARCLVLQRLGPCATDVLSMWRQEQNGVQKEGQEECGRGSAGGRGATGAGRREAAAGGGACGGLPPCAVKRFARQALLALDLMHRSARLAHCDIKPGNFCLSLDQPTHRHHHHHHVPHQHQQPCQQASGIAPADPGRSSALVTGMSPGHSSALRGDMATWTWRLLDFGNACSLEAVDGARPPGGRIRPCAAVVQHGAAVLWYDTPSYAAPDVALGLPPSAASDMWSLACTVYELASGRQLFPVPQHLLYGSGDGYDGDSLTANDVHLALVQQMLGPLPQRLLRRAPAAREHFDRFTGRLLLEEEFEALPLKPLAAKAAEDLGGPSRAAAAAGRGGTSCGLGAEAGRPVKGRVGCGEQGDDSLRWTEGEREGLVSFLTPLVRWDPRERWSARQAANHPWLRCGP